MTVTEFKSIIEARGPAQRDGRDWRGRCPVCNDTGRRGNLAFREGEDGRILIRCWSGCKFKEIVAALGLTAENFSPGDNGHATPRPKSQPKARPQTVYASIEAAGSAIAKRLCGRFTQHWTYENRDGTQAFVVLRFDECKTLKGEKTYRPIHRERSGYVEADPLGLLPLYRLPDLLADATSMVFMCEGEKAGDAARSIGLLATTSAHGAKSADKSDFSPLAGRDVILLPDNDTDGRAYAAAVRDIILKLNPPAHVRIVNLPDLPKKGDIVDWLDARDSTEPETLRAQIDGMVEAAELAKTEGRIEIQVINAATWLESEPPESDQIIQETFDRGDKVALIGSSKVRKSFAVGQMGLSLASGRNFLGWAVPKPRRVFHVQFEIQANHFHRRVRRLAKAMGITPGELGDRLQIVNGRGLGITGPAGIKQIAEFAKPFEPDVIVFDPLYKVASGVENAAEDAKIVLNAFDELAEATGAGIVFVHHDSKGFAGDRDIRDRGAGSNIIGRDYDACLTLTPHVSEESCIVLETLLRNYKPQDPRTVEWTEDPATGGYCFRLRPDIVPTKRTSSNARTQQEAMSPELFLSAALELLKNEAVPIGEFREKLKGKTGLTYARVDAFKKWALLQSHLDVFECRGRGQHKKLIGTPEQIAKAKADNV